MQKLVLFMVILLVGACVINDVAEAKKKGGTMLYRIMKKVPVMPIRPKMVKVSSRLTISDWMKIYGYICMTNFSFGKSNTRFISDKIDH